MKKKFIAVLSGVSICLAAATACGAQSSTDSENMTQASEIGESAQTENMTDVSENVQDSEADEKLTFVSQNGTSIKEDDSAVYLFSKTCIYTVDKAVNQTGLLWKNDSFEEANYSALNGCGVVLGEKLYFLEEIPYETEDGVYAATVLSVINADGSGYEQAVSMSEELYGYNGLYYSDGILYAYRNKLADCYEIAEDGSLGEKIPAKKTAFAYVQALDEYDLVNSHDLTQVLSPAESMDKYGCLILRNDSSYVRYDVESGSAETLDCENIVAWLDGSLLFLDYETGGRRLERVDVATGECSVIADIGGLGATYTAYAGDTFCYMINDDEQGLLIGAISVSDGTGGVLLALDDTSGYAGYFSPMTFGLKASGNALYYMDMLDYDAYLMKIDLDTLRSQQVDGALYATGIGAVGELEKTYWELYGGEDNDVVMGTVTMNRLVLDDAFAGAEKINAYLAQERDSRHAGFENAVYADAEFLADAGVPYSYSSDVSKIQYFDGQYLSFIQDGYEYVGGAHGMPIWEGYTFDLETGERLYLSDIISNTEEELKEIVTRYFGEMIDASPANYWEDAKETVYGIFTLENTDFALTDEGIRFYTAPYNIAAYAAGYQQVTVPYSEFEMEIEIG